MDCKTVVLKFILVTIATTTTVFSSDYYCRWDPYDRSKCVINDYNTNIDPNFEATIKISNDSVSYEEITVLYFRGFEPYGFEKLKRINHNFSNLEKLSIDGIDFEEIDVDFFEGYKLSNFGIVMSKMSNISQKLFDPLAGNLTRLSLFYNNIVNVDENAFEKLVNLKFLNLARNQITTIHPRVFHSLVGLTYMSLEENQIKELDENLFLKLELLEEIWLRFNKIEILPKNLFVENFNLKKIKLGYNKIKFIDGGTFKYLRNLEELDLYNNDIAVINPRAFEGLQNLNQLKLSNNKIKNLDSNLLKSLVALKYLDLRDNQIESLPNGLFLQNVELCDLNLGFNSLKFLNVNTFESLKNLENLDLGNNEISAIQDFTFTKLFSLIRLYLNDNKIKRIPQHFTSVESTLIHIFLRNNDIAHIDKRAFHPLPQNSLDLRGNECIDEEFWTRNASNSIVLDIKTQLFCQNEEDDLKPNNIEYYVWKIVMYVTLAILALVISFIIIVIACKNRKVRASFTKMANLFQKWSENTTIHGIRYFGGTDGIWISKILWCIVMIVMMVLLSIHIQKTYVKWQESPVIISFENIERGVWEVPFPAITICLEHKLKPEISGTVFKSSRAEYETVFSDICPQFWNKYEEVNATNSENFVDFFKEISYYYPYNILHKKFKNEDLNLLEILTDIGMCLSFNLLNQSYIFNTDVIDPKFLEKIVEEGTDPSDPVVVPVSAKIKKEKIFRIPYNWNIESGYSEKFTLKEFPLRSTTSNTDLGFEFDIKLNGAEYSSLQCNGFNGVKVSVHFPGDWPRLKHQYISFSPNTKGSIFIKPQLLTVSDSLREYETHKRQCFYPDERKLLFFKIYTKSNCELECLTNFTLSFCGCVSFTMPRKAGTRICEYSNLECMHVVAANINLVNRGSLKSKNTKSNCNCLPSCTSITYDFEVSSHEIPNNSQYQQKIFGLKVSMKEDTFVAQVKSELYGFIDFLANIGGLLGLFAGISIISFVEIIYFMSKAFQ